MRIEIVRTEQKNPQAQVWMWRFRASNGRLIAGAETYETISNAKRAAQQAVRSIAQVHTGARLAVHFSTPRWTKNYFVITWTVWAGGRA